MMRAERAQAVWPRSLGSLSSGLGALPPRGERPAARTTARSPEALDKALAFIETHFAEMVRLEQLASLSALSVSRFITVFREQFGCSPYRYLCEVRIRHAQVLLLAGVPGSVVATEVGFFDQSHFGRHFKRSCGMTPSTYVRQAAQHAANATPSLGADLPAATTATTASNTSTACYSANTVTATAI